MSSSINTNFNSFRVRWECPFVSCGNSFTTPPAPKPHLFTLSHRPQSRNQVYLGNIYKKIVQTLQLSVYFTIKYIDLVVTISLKFFILLAFQLVLCLVV